MSRSDNHRLAVIDPAEYQLVAFEDMHEEDGMIEVTNLDGIDGLDRTFYVRKNVSGEWIVRTVHSYTESDLFVALMERVENPHYGCQICGQAHGNRYWYYFQHIPTGDVIRVGSQCAIMVGLGSREELEDRRAHERREMAIERGHHLFGHAARRQALGVATDAVMDWQAKYDIKPFNATGSKLMVYTSEAQTPWIIKFAADVLNRFNREGHLSDKQWKILCEFVERSAKDEAREKQAESREEQWARENAEAEEIPTEGRVRITGTVIKIEEEEDPYNYGATKRVMTVKDERGFRVKGTVPSSIWNVEKSDTVTFDARCKQSKPNPKFGYFSRPTKAEIKETVNA